MFSKEFMRFLINYQTDVNEVRSDDTVKEIKFKDNRGIPAKVFATIKQK